MSLARLYSGLPVMPEQVVTDLEIAERMARDAKVRDWLRTATDARLPVMLEEAVRDWDPYDYRYLGPDYGEAVWCGSADYKRLTRAAPFQFLDIRDFWHVVLVMDGRRVNRKRIYDRRDIHRAVAAMATRLAQLARRRPEEPSLQDPHWRLAVEELLRRAPELSQIQLYGFFLRGRKVNDGTPGSRAERRLLDELYKKGRSKRDEEQSEVGLKDDIDAVAIPTLGEYCLTPSVAREPMSRLLSLWLAIVRLQRDHEGTLDLRSVMESFRGKMLKLLCLHREVGVRQLLAYCDKFQQEWYWDHPDGWALDYERRLRRPAPRRRRNGERSISYSLDTANGGPLQVYYKILVAAVESRTELMLVPAAAELIGTGGTSSDRRRWWDNQSRRLENLLKYPEPLFDLLEQKTPELLVNRNGADDPDAVTAHLRVLFETEGDEERLRLLENSDGLAAADLYRRVLYCGAAAAEPDPLDVPF